MKTCAAWIVLLMYLLCSCKNINIEDNYKSQYLTLEFKCSKVNNKTVEEVDSKAPYFPYGFKTAIYIFNSQTFWPHIAGSPIVATSYGGSDLIPDKEILLPKGVYDIYCVSENSPAISFLNIYHGIASGLVNGKDYLWAKREGVLLLKNEQVNLLFKHIASRLLVTVSTEESNSSILVNSFRITLPEAAANTLNLGDGTISPSAYTEQLSTIEGYGNTREILLLPCLAKLNFEFDAQVLTEGSSPVIRTFFGEINQQLIAGNSYELSIKIKSDLAIKIEVRGYPTNIVDNHIIFKSINN
ncbi:MAG: hypothetical protein CVU12_05230 [Bacteroidetes bacterium HGW-Bacteroidetes-7]|jgi:hypothetical protein|nr:MAG: hypothetical protein CVU12_05230 [Bacteroidetes bacterium HGW-Bacteroidetes-7]